VVPRPVHAHVFSARRRAERVDALPPMLLLAVQRPQGHASETGAGTRWRGLGL